MITTIFFDLDGTLIDQKTAQNEACLSLYYAYEFDAVISEEEFVKKWDDLTKFHYDSYLKRECTYNEQRERRIFDLFFTYGVDMKEKDLLEIYDEYLYYFEKNWRTYPEIKACLDALTGYRLGVLTNGDYVQQNQKLKMTEIAHYFSHVVCAGDYSYSKPDFRLFETACKLSGASMEEFLYVGDSYKSDIIPCIEHGMKCVFINRKNKPVDKSIFAIATCEELPAIVSKINEDKKEFP